MYSVPHIVLNKVLDVIAKLGQNCFELIFTIVDQIAYLNFLRLCKFFKIQELILSVVLVILPLKSNPFL